LSIKAQETTMNTPTRHTTTAREALPPTQDEWRPQAGHDLKRLGAALMWGVVIAAPLLAVGASMNYGLWREREDARLAAVEMSVAYQRMVAAAPGPVLPLESAVHGRELFTSVCAACHGKTGTGIDGLGRNLTDSNFVAYQDDDQLRQFIITGRPTARPMPMPPRAGHDELTDADLRDIVVYVRGLQDPRRMPALPEQAVASGPTQADKDAALAAAGGDAELAGYIANGNTLFHIACNACHGKGGVGIAGNGKPLVHNSFVASMDDDSLLAFIQKGRGPTDPMNTTGIQMPPKGGNPALSEDDILDIISYLRTLQESGQTAATTK
jgi:mono/diheme cytochrome c family protein